MTTTSLSLIRRVARPDDHEAWERFRATYGAIILGYVRSEGNKRSCRLQDADADEVVQTVFVKLFRTLPEFRLDHDRGRFRTWLHTVSSHALMDFLRKRSRTRERQPGDDVPEPPQPTPEPGPDPDGVRSAVLQRVLQEVRSEIERTNPAKWRSFEEHGLKGRPALEVAEELGISRNLVYQNTVRTMTAVKQRCLEQYEESLADE